MIPLDWVYCRPDTLAEAASAYVDFLKKGLSPVYYGGGSEIITMSRAGSIQPGAVVDLKGIPECLELKRDADKLIIGAANSLSQISESKLFPLLGTAAGRIADHTNQCRITLGGNLCATIIYRETSLPLLLCDAKVVLCGPKGLRTKAFSAVFSGRIALKPGEFVTQVHIPAWALQAPYIHVKKTTHEKIDYPLVNVTALHTGMEIRVAFSGVCAFPFRSKEIEQVLGDRSLSREARVQAAAGMLPELALGDVEGSGAYRVLVMKNTLLELLEEWQL